MFRELFRALFRERAEPTSDAQRDTAHLAAIVDSSDDAIISKTPKGIVTSWNRAAERLFGWTAAEAVGQPITLIIPEDRLDEEREVIAKILRGETIDHYETVRRRKDGSLVAVALTVSPIRDRKGTVIGASKIARDISERRRLEADRAALLVHAERARGDAERANRLKDEFLATLSHELRTPLNSILGWVHMLRDPSADEALRRRGLEVVDRNVVALARLVDDVLDISAITMGRLRLETSPVDLPAVIDAAIDAVRPAAEAKGIRIERALTRDLPPVLGDAARLQQLVWNLLSNAVKFTARGGRVDVRLGREGTEAVITVSDDGAGIEPEFMSRLFDRFAQADSSPTRRHGGLGIGLAIVRHVSELHGGRAEAESAGVGRGSTFRVRLPLPMGAPLRSGGTARGVGDVLDGVRVLAVDDEPDTRDLIAVVLRSVGARVTVAGSADEALSLMSGERPDVVLCDIAMPGRDGIDLLREARQRGLASAGTPFVALTAYARDEDRQRLAAAGFALYIAKPVDPLTLVRGVIGMLSR